ncbi:hypothetical protein QYE76_006993 [Lolium multiflorum]|uniref:F-box domain-containing protein n=1 Tax=Lolium multiflorum TaxID=4521 RepID=A0AAD8RWU0_LOLMU|nr:hypothetical protein QYE76_006993 [Lolium multiflorum]
MGKRKKEDDEEGQVAAAAGPWASVPIDLLPEILSRVPYRSLCRFKCVSRAWLALCSDPAVRKRSPQALSGFFCYRGSSPARSRFDFLNLSGRGRPLVDPSLSFVRGYQEVTPLHCCGGILICYCRRVDMKEAEYVVCNPATEEIWAVLTAPRNELIQGLNNTCLCFDPTIRRCFTVFVFMHNCTGISRVEVYSSETGQWTSMKSEWSPGTVVDSRCVFFNGALHSTTRPRSLDQEGKLIRWMVTVDTEGKTWRRIQMPHDIDSSGCIWQSQGRLCAAHIRHEYGFQLSVWVLEDYASGKWTLNHTASILELLGRPRFEVGERYMLIAIHPEHNLIFLKGGVRLEETLMSYDMDSKKLQVICFLGESQAWRFQPYIPCFVEKPSASDGHEQLNIC